MSDEIEISNRRDQPIALNADPLLSQVSEVYAEAVRNRDIWMVIDKAAELLAVTRISGLALAKLLYLIKTGWSELGVNDEFRDVIFERLGLSYPTIDRYVTTWEMFAMGKVPEALADQVRQLPMKSLIPISKAVAQGYDISPDNWQELAQAPDDATIRQTIRNIKGEEPRKSSIRLTLSRKGDITAHCNDGSYFIGYLNVDKMNEDVIGKAIRRIVENSGIMVD